MPEHRVPLIGTALRRFEDPENSRDPRVSAVVAALKQLPPDAIAPAPAPDFRAELRTQLVAVAPRIVVEEAATAAPSTRPTGDPLPTAKPASTPAREARARQRIGFGRPLRLAGAVLTLCLIALGGVVWASQRAVPGDALYGMKRASESVRLLLATSDAARAKLYLGFAGTRVQEAKILVERSVTESSALSAAGRVSPATAALVRQTLGSSDSDIRAATRLLTTDAVRTHSAGDLATVRRWAPSQLGRLRQLAAMLPSGALRHRATASSRLVRQAVQRTRVVDTSLDRPCLARSKRDSLGVEPCGGATPQHPGTRQRPTRPGASGGRHQPGTHPGTSGRPTATGGPTGSTAPGGTKHKQGGGPGGPGPTSSSPTLPVPVPTLPLPTVSLPTSLPVTAGSCGVSLPGATLGTCPSS